ncbi:MAG: substrate-binding domain-containing protein [Magnetospirillum sp.]|nr:substrate-binding domain-containing protein [Magnetospirillum sp.]
MSFYRLSAAVGLALCIAVPSSQAQTVRAAGTGIGIALVRILAESYERDHPGAKILVPESVGTGGAIKGLESGKIDVGILARPLAAGEVEQGVAITLCRTALVFFTSAARKDVSLTRQDLPALFTASLPAFAAGEVRMLLRPPTDTGFIRLVESFPELSPVIAAAREARGANLALTDQDAMDAVEASRSLVAFGAMAPLLAEKRKLSVIALDGITPGIAGLENGRYPYFLPVVLALGSKSSEGARRFLDYAVSAAAAPVLRANGCLPATARQYP